MSRKGKKAVVQSAKVGLQLEMFYNKLCQTNNAFLLGELLLMFENLGKNSLGNSANSRILNVDASNLQDGSNQHLASTGSVPTSGTDGIPDTHPVLSGTSPDAPSSADATTVRANYQLIWLGSPNFWGGRNGNRIVAIVDHIMQSSFASADAWFHNSASQVSAHFGITLDGRVYQWVRTENTAWANGFLNQPDTNIDWIANALNNNINPNYFTLSIEHEGYTGNPFPEAQYQASLWLHKHLIGNYGVQPDRQHIVGHYKLDSINRPYCPGTGFPWNRLMQDLAAAVPGGTSPAAPNQQFVPGMFGPGTVLIDNAYVRAKPSYGSDGTVLRRLPRGTILHFAAYLDGGPAYQGGTRWYEIAPQDGGGWIHSKEIG